MRLLRKSHEWAADRGWAQYPEPEWRRRQRSKRDWIDFAFKWGVVGWLMWWIWAPVLLGILIGAVMVLGMFHG